MKTARAAELKRPVELARFHGIWKRYRECMAAAVKPFVAIIGLPLWIYLGPKKTREMWEVSY